ncbi:hypothetical protein Zmor_016447 [Zophobas morio]|uniref:DNA-directed DNA polymerase n=1 Tax=Zophobas morio TaxID=2755281 RepID=A0AA38M086_9CUCU|nr:hypothetical protein Zmor_016447 [Zophobas morio]
MNLKTNPTEIFKNLELGIDNNVNEKKSPLDISKIDIINNYNYSGCGKGKLLSQYSLEEIKNESHLKTHSQILQTKDNRLTDSKTVIFLNESKKFEDKLTHTEKKLNGKETYQAIDERLLNPYVRPPFSYATLIARAIMSDPNDLYNASSNSSNYVDDVILGGNNKSLGCDLICFPPLSRIKFSSPNSGFSVLPKLEELEPESYTDSNSFLSTGFDPLPSAIDEGHYNSNFSFANRDRMFSLNNLNASEELLWAAPGLFCETAKEKTSDISNSIFLNELTKGESINPFNCIQNLNFNDNTCPDISVENLFGNDNLPFETPSYDSASPYNLNLCKKTNLYNSPEYSDFLNSTEISGKFVEQLIKMDSLEKKNYSLNGSDDWSVIKSSLYHNSNEFSYKNEVKGSNIESNFDFTKSQAVTTIDKDELALLNALHNIFPTYQNNVNNKKTDVIRKDPATDDLCPNHIQEINLAFDYNNLKLNDMIPANNKYIEDDILNNSDLLGLLERKEQFSESWALFYFAEMAIGVNTLHGLGYIHRDIKAQNFLLHSSGHVVLTGFGSACRMTNRKSDQAIYVTTEYMSPELVRMLRGEHVVYGPSLIEEEQARMNFEDIKNHEVFKKVDWQSAVESSKKLSLYLLACGADVTIPDGENLKVTEKTQDPEILDGLLERHNLGTQRLKPFPPVDQLELPPLDGDVITYLNDVAQKQCEPYKQYSMNLSTLKPSPMPKEWRLSSGWTRYDTISSGAAAKGERVSAPLGNAMVFDVEVNFRESQYPVIAVALCYENVQQDGQDPDSTFVNGVWYSWCSSNLVSLPGTEFARFCVYDRARLECEYTFEESNNRFLDTMSMHISLNGLTAAQKRLLLKLRKATALGTASEEKLVRIRDMWTKVAALNSLKDVYRLYIKKELDKTARDLFVEGSLEDIKENAQDCFRYCAADVLATLEVYQKMYDQYFEACPSPATFAGTLLLSTPVLPVKKATFEYYIARCDAKLKETEEMVIGTLKKLLNEALKKVCLSICFSPSPHILLFVQNPSEIEKDPFLNHLDWSLPKAVCFRASCDRYRDLCDRTGTPVMTLRKRITPYLLRMRWDGFPIYYHKPNRTWGFDHPTTGFHQLPRRDKEHAKTGTPLAKVPAYQTFQFEIEQSKLKGRQEAIPILNAAIETSYWIGTRKRANEQFIHDGFQEVLSFSPLCLPECISPDIIIPMLVPSGTITRRAVEPLWLTASSPKMNRIGSELKAQVRAPKGYYFVGSDVDSQELWIAAVLGDAYFTGLHGSTALGWMTVSGEKSFKTDLHSRTAEQIAVSRDVAKIFNYGRIYGSGVSSARRMLINSIPDLTLSEADEKAHDLYKSTKGHKVMCTVKYDSERFSELYVWRAAGGCSSLLWVGGSESHMFNSLEQVVNSTYPRTPFLGSGISNMLKSSVAGSNYSTSRVNWVVQSSAVDFLHLLLVSMEHFCKRYCIRYKFVISIHDEVRFLVSERDRYRAALALHLSNLYVRAYFSMRLGMHDLPMSVAFFSKVDVDKVLRKEVPLLTTFLFRRLIGLQVNLESVTPSNPIPLPCVGESLSIYEVLKKTNGSLLLNKQPPLESTEAVGSFSE